MKKILHTSLLVFSFIFFVSCTSQKDLDTGNVNKEEVKVEQSVEVTTDFITMEQEINAMDLKQVFDGIPGSLVSDKNFKICSANAIDMCVGEQAHSQNTAINCDSYLLTQNKQVCLESNMIREAKMQGDENLCDAVIGNIEGCKYEVITAQAIKTYDVSICDSLGEGLKNPCINTTINAKALNEKNPDICRDIIPYEKGDTVEREFCEDEVKYSNIQNNETKEMSLEIIKQEDTSTN